MEIPQGNTLENSGKRNPKMGFKSPPEHICVRILWRHMLEYLFLTRLFTILFGLVGIIGTAFSGVPPNLPFTLQEDSVLGVGGGLSGAYFAADGRTGWALNPDGTVLATRDGGDTWQSQPSPTTAGLLSITFAADGRTGWMVGHSGTILNTHDGGDTWRPQASGITHSLNSVTFAADGRTGWAVGESGTIVATRDGGATWLRQSSGTTVILNRVTFAADGRTGWAVGERGTMLATRDGGDTWQPRPSLASSSLADVSFAADGRSGWAVGVDAILATRDGGDTWQRQHSDNRAILTGVYAAADGRTAWVVGLNGTILATRDGGNTWEDQKSGTKTAELSWVHFANDGRTGWAFGMDGAILATHNAGYTWGTQWYATPLYAIYFTADERTGWMVGNGGTILASHDGGKTWERQPSGTIVATRDGGATWLQQRSGTAAKLGHVCFAADGRSGWVVGWNGTILSTNDGGDTWHRQTSDATNNLIGITCGADGRSGWAVGDYGTILATHDGGLKWLRQTSGTAYELSGVYFAADGRTGWAVGVGGTVLATRDGGDTWQEQTSGTNRLLYSVTFAADRCTGWTVGEDGTILATRDGGDTWQPRHSGMGTNLYGIHFADTSRRAWLVGDELTVIELSSAIPAPWADGAKADPIFNPLASGLNTQVDISFSVHTGHSAHVNAVWVLERVSDRASWTKLGCAQASAEHDRMHLLWMPADYNVSTGDSVEYAARFEDDGPPFTTPLGRFAFDSWLSRTWRESYATIVSLAVPLAVLLLYASAFGIVLLAAPARLAKVGRAAALDSVSAPIGNLAFAWQLACMLFEGATLPWLCRHPRVRRAWIAQYRRGEVRLRDLGKPARESFLEHPEVLDTWVSAHIKRASEALEGFDLCAQRQIYVECPVRIGSGKSGQLIERPSPNTLRAAFARQRAVVAIVGPGGTGKSTLACAIARWAMSNEADIRLLPHPMLPVFIAQDTSDLTDAVTRSLREMLGEEELPDDLVRGLLSTQRLLIIVDGLSEREPATQELVTRIFGESSIFNTLVITSRSEPRLGATARTTLFPVLLDAKRVVPFIVDYLARLETVEALQDGRVQLQLGEQILELAESSGGKAPVTPLLVKLFVDSAVGRAAAGMSLHDMPRAVPDVFIDYLRRLNSGDDLEGTSAQDEAFIAAGQVLAEVSLGATLIPGDFAPQQALEALGKANPAGQNEFLLARLVASGLIERRLLGGIPFLRFSLDPVAEYLAAIRKLFELRQGGRSAVDQYAAELSRIESYPRACDGYLTAFATCYRVYHGLLGLPEMDLPWERPSFRPAASAARS